MESHLGLTTLLALMVGKSSCTVAEFIFLHWIFLYLHISLLGLLHRSDCWLGFAVKRCLDKIHCSSCKIVTLRTAKFVDEFMLACLNFFEVFTFLICRGGMLTCRISVSLCCFYLLTSTPMHQAIWSSSGQVI